MNEVATTGNTALTVTTEQQALVKSMIFPDASDRELELFYYECARHGVHPLDRKIFPIKRNDSESGGKKLTFQCSIDYFRSAAMTSGDYDGQDEPEFGPLVDQGYPEYAKVAVWRKGVSRPFVGVARWKEYYPGEKMGFMWRKMPHGQLAKCAEALAFRKAFPQTLSNLYADEEMAQATTGGMVYEQPLASTVKKADHPASLPPSPSSETKKTVQDTLNDELEAYEPDPDKRALVLKTLTIFGESGKEKWMRKIDGSSDKWCGKALENLRKLAAEKKPSSPVEKEAPPLPDGCTRNPRVCLSAEWLDGGDVTCLELKTPCPYNHNSRG